MTRYRSWSIYVGNLPSGISEYEWGDIVDIEVKNHQSASSYAFVKFEHNEEAKDAISMRDGYKYDGYRLRVEWAHSGKGSTSNSCGASQHAEYQLLVTGLPSSASVQELKLHMEEAADVCFSEVHHEKSGTVGIVEFKDKESMDYAAQTLNNSEFRNANCRRYIRVKKNDGEHNRLHSRKRSRSRSLTRSYSRRHRSKWPRRSSSTSRSRLRSDSSSMSRSQASSNKQNSSRSPRMVDEFREEEDQLSSTK